MEARVKIYRPFNPNEESCRIDLRTGRMYHVLDLTGNKVDDLIQQARELYPDLILVEVYSNKDVQNGTIMGHWAKKG